MDSAQQRLAPRPYVLVVDDSVDGRDMLAEYLTFRGFDVETAAGGLDAIARAIARQPVLVLMDLAMPGGDGWKATRSLKADARTQDVIVIAVTAHAFTQDVVKIRAAGADGFVSKPFDIVRLADAITTVVENGRPGLSALTLAGGVDLSAIPEGA